MTTIVEQLPVGSDIQNALLGKSNIILSILQMVKSYELGEWEKIDIMCQKLKIEQAELPAFYYEAVKWSDILYNCTHDPL